MLDGLETLSSRWDLSGICGFRRVLPGVAQTFLPTTTPHFSQSTVLDQV